MTGPEHFRRAEELAAKAAEYLGQGDGQDSAAIWAAVAQVHATLAVAAARGLNTEQVPERFPSMLSAHERETLKPMKKDNP
jgi:hypothetical protein